MVITAINKKDDNNFIIHLDNGDKLYLSLEVFMKNGLRKGDEISEDRFAFFVRENQKYFVRLSALRFIANRLHSSRELNTKLLKKKYDKEIVAEIVADLSSKGLINDFDFALAYAGENVRNKQWGKNKIKAGLFQKGVASQIIDKVLEGFFAEDDELDNAVRLAQKKKNILVKRNMDEQKLKQKLITFLISRGYSYELAKNALYKMSLPVDDE